MLAIARLPIFALCTVNESRCFSVEAMQTIGLLVDEGVVLRDELPANLRRVNGGG